MKILLKTTKRRALFLAIAACLIAGAATSAFAVPPTQVVRNRDFPTFIGACCFSWNETVQINEPAKVVPVVVTWSATYGNSLGHIVGLMVNGGPCIAYGPRSIYFDDDRGNQTRTFNWVVFPTDGIPGSDFQLHKGINTFTLCGGGKFFDTQGIDMGINTLSVRISQ